MPIVRVARHGETTWNAEERYQGRHDTPLSSLGRRQADALARVLAPFPIRSIISSPLERCRETAQPFADLSGLHPRLSPLLVEIAHGSWEGRLRAELQRDDPQRLFAWKNDAEHVTFPAGESVPDVRARWERFADTFDEREDTLVVTHDVVARLAILRAQGRPAADLWKPEVRNGAFAVYSVDGLKWTLLEECVKDHLGVLATDPDQQAL
ncbi:MAG: histidine phosphatase family protein [Candidatus Eremiobacteraeota bacterium]|nr:histidine phosphatase family protein [Candidatus Eremiobacteraeota bacterium]